MELVTELIEMLHPRDFGFFSWNPQEKGDVEKLEIKQLYTVTVEDVMKCLKIGGVPPKLQDISDINKSLGDGPVEVGKGAK